MLQGAEEEVAYVIILRRDEWVTVGMLLADVDVLDGEELLVWGVWPRVPTVQNMGRTIRDGLAH